MSSGGVRWAFCAVIVAAAHGCAWFVLTTPNVISDSDAGSPIVTLELSPISAAPAPPLDAQADAPPDAQAAPETPPVAQVAPAPSPEPTPPVTQPAPTTEPSPAPPLAEVTPTPEPNLDPTPPPTREPVPPQRTNDPNPPPPAMTATPDAVSAPPPPPTRPTPVKETPTVLDTAPQPPSPPPSAPSVDAAATADVPSAPTLSPGREETVSLAALQSWQRELIVQIERHKRFPASARGRAGVARVAFSIDRDGRLTSVRILGSSGSTELDQAALELIRRSQPFPAPPAALRESDLSFVAPVRYLPSASR